MGKSKFDANEGDISILNNMKMYDCAIACSFMPGCAGITHIEQDSNKCILKNNKALENWDNYNKMGKNYVSSGHDRIFLRKYIS